jgi:hypothetical protein
MSDIPQSDVSRPSKLPTAKLLPHGAALPATEQTPAEYLEAAEEEWNKRVDVEIETLAEGMVDLVNLASVSSHEIPLGRLDICTVVRSTIKINLKSRRRHSKHSSAQSLWFFFSPYVPLHKFRTFDLDQGGELSALHRSFYETTTAPIRRSADRRKAGCRACDNLARKGGGKG